MVFNPQIGHFDTNQITPEVNQILKDIGVTKEELENRESAEVIF